MKIDNDKLSDSELMIKNQFQDYMNEMQNKMMSLQGINSGRMKRDSVSESSGRENGSESENEMSASVVKDDSKNKRLKLFEENLKEVEQELKYNNKRDERNLSVGILMRFWCWLIGVKSLVKMPMTKQEIDNMSFIDKLRYKTIQYIKYNNKVK